MAPAERWLGVVTVQAQAEHLLLAARSMWNLLQFDRPRKAKAGMPSATNGVAFMGIQWRRFCIGLAVLAVAQLVA